MYMTVKEPCKIAKIGCRPVNHRGKADTFIFFKINHLVKSCGCIRQMVHGCFIRS
ncbi:hypothetical protein [Moraxella lacunata]|uniref:hypothetical protein n=1 Tax=Moraxella lacunata TaxID=477 RepID=UPI003EDF0019